SACNVRKSVESEGVGKRTCHKGWTIKEGNNSGSNSPQVLAHYAASDRIASGKVIHDQSKVLIGRVSVANYAVTINCRGTNSYGYRSAGCMAISPYLLHVILVVCNATRGR